MLDELFAFGDPVESTLKKVKKCGGEKKTNE
jgi:hypothetical protein